MATKQPLPQWLSIEEAKAHGAAGASVWEWAGNGDQGDPQVVLAAAGNNMTVEILAAAQILREELPQLSFRVVNVTDLMVIDSRGDHPHAMQNEEFTRLFTADRPVVFAFHGYPSAIHQLIYKRPEQERFHVRGYIEEGTTTTPFDMLLRNGTSRWQLALAAMQRAQGWSSAVAPVIERYAGKLDEHRRFIEANGYDPPEITSWRWSSS